VKVAPPPRPDYGPRDGNGTGAQTATQAPSPQHVSRMTFTGVGSEYFRIWVVNLLLTLLTLGIYSAWAKVRKMRYFLQNTQLDRHAFDYHGDPRAILLGRIVALVLVLAYTFAFDVSRTTGLVMVVVLCAVGPWLFMRAQRFRLANTSWRGLRFGFDAHPGEAYRIVLPPLVIWFSSAIATAFVGTSRNMAYGAGALAATAVLTFALVPWIHHRLKAYQHRRARYGAETFEFLSVPRSFYAIYGNATLLMLLGSVLGFLLILLVSWMSAGQAQNFDSMSKVIALIVGGTVGVTMFVLAWPYFAARMQAVVWQNTRLGDVRFRTLIEAMPLARLTLRNVALTIATLGLYWPFAAVALARYRVECMCVHSERALGDVAQATHAAPGAATGDAAVDAFGLDIGL
jgi:uncharacterized membrane protein YjgN (DUF898 family)